MADSRQMSLVEKLAAQVTRVEEARAAAGDATPGDVAPYAAPATRDNVLESLLPGQQFRIIDVTLIAPAGDGQARQEFDEARLRTLADSLKRSGVREPIIVTPHGAAPGRFQIVAGERRWRAAQLAGLAQIPCIVDPNLADRREKLLAQAEENFHRENLNPVEEGRALAQIMESREIDVRAAGELIGRSYAQARRLYRIHMAIEPIKQAIVRGDLDARGGIEVDRIYNSFVEKSGKEEGRRLTEQLLERVVAEKWSVRRIEQYATRLSGGNDDEPRGAMPTTRMRPDAESQAPAGRGQGGSGGDAGESIVASGAVQGATPLCSRRDGQVVIQESRIQRGCVTPEEREQLIALLEELLMRVRRV